MRAPTIGTTHKATLATFIMGSLFLFVMKGDLENTISIKINNINTDYDNEIYVTLKKERAYVCVCVL